ncbi:RNA polymerase sigma factor [Streptomyces hyderabadensis]|uniref:Sigma-70 family RNA polymerase sigma factor n=1 Tax=Streptomyces hyderabadensis TaxID=598549 RepID=A0ABP9IYW2_9ACTN|nr:sigma-70 family RNA polymerase sigma factor [Streptomyces hyderabadensis]
MYLRQQSAGPPDRQQVWQDVARHHDRLMALVRKRLPTRQDAEDCVQEAMIRTAAYPGLDLARLGPFLTTVALRLVADFYRVQHRHRTLAHRAYVADVPVSPENDICDAAFGRWLLERVHALPPRQRDVLLARVEGLPVTAFAVRQGISAKAAEGAYTRGRARLRELALRELAASAARADAFVAEPGPL